MFTKNISFKNFLIRKKNLSVKKNLNLILSEKNQVIHSLSKFYKDSFNKKNIKHFNKKLDYRIIGMGGSILGAQAIYDFLKKKIKKNFLFINNLHNQRSNINKSIYTNLVISKSGNTVETIVNANILLKKKEKNIFITEKKNNYLFDLAQKLKADNVGEQILFDAIRAPYATILNNAGLNLNVNIIEGTGINVITGDAVNMIDSGIIDPVLVTKSALKNAVSVVTTIISADCVISNIRINEGS